MLNIVDNGLILNKLCALLPVHGASVLAIEKFPCSPRSKAAWLDLLGALPNIEFLSFTGHPPAPEYIVDLLFAQAGSANNAATDEAQPRYFMPKLKQILLHQVKFRESDDFRDPVFVVALRAILERRKAAGCPVKRLIMQECLNMDENDISVLHEVIQVVWDGLVDYEGEDKDDNEDNDNEDSGDEYDSDMDDSGGD